MSIDRQSLMKSQQFEDALAEGVKLKKEIDTTYKAKNKTSYKEFCEVMYEANPHIQAILDKRRKDRDDAELQELSEYKSKVSAMYRQAQDFLAPEKLEEGKKTKVQKIVEKIIPVLDILRYIDSTKLDDEFAKYGLVLQRTTTLEQDISGLADPGKKTAVKSIFNDASNVRKQIQANNEQINEMVFSTKVPPELQYDKDTNNIGLKPGDFRKIVDMKTKLELAPTKEAKERVDEKIGHAVEEKQFEMARAELVRDKLNDLA